MNHGHKKLFFFLFFVLLGFCILLVWQIKKNIDMDTEQTDRPLIEKNSIDIPLTKDEPVFGNRGAAITVVEYIDLNSEDSLKIHEEIKNFVTKNPEQVRLVWKDFPKQSFFGKDVNKTHRAALCIAEQNQSNFWKFIDEFSVSKDKKDEATLLSLGTKYAADQDKWKACATSSSTEEKITDSVKFITSLGLKKAPVIFINNRLVNYVDEIDIPDLLKQIVTAETKTEE